MILIILSLFLLLCFTVFLIDRTISWKTRDSIYFDIDNVPPYDIGLVLGTSKYIGHTLNDFYAHRINTAIALYHQKKVSELLLSGDNAHRSYNEPWTMKRDLLKAGVPENAIHLDYAGFRTLDSIIRAKAIFEADDFLIITQAFHCERALYIAQYHDINASCLAVEGSDKYSGFRLRLREVFARTKAFIDLYVLDLGPKFLGPQNPIVIPTPESPVSESTSSESPADKTIPADMDSEENTNLKASSKEVDEQKNSEEYTVEIDIKTVDKTSDNH